MQDFTPTRRPASASAPAVKFSITGEPYLFTPPKTAALALGMIKSTDEMTRLRTMFQWLGQGLAPDHEPWGEYAGHESFDVDCQACRLEARFKDPGDELDMELLSEVVQWLLTEVARRPPTRSGASAASRRATGKRSTDGAAVEE